MPTSSYESPWTDSYNPLAAHLLEQKSYDKSESSTITRRTENAGLPKNLQKRLIQ